MRMSIVSSRNSGQHASTSMYAVQHAWCVTKELKFAVRIEHPGTPDEKITGTLDTKAMRESAE